ncbi:hypothetical protein C2E23DRAFT_813056 [Lenzites betulinus]|nr:hypothetical protein C2E23DRAFT_813056 [Lenzites betulinus]
MPPGDLPAKRNELRSNVHGKMQTIPYDEFKKAFFPDCPKVPYKRPPRGVSKAAARSTRKNVPAAPKTLFSGLKACTSEHKMYRQLTTTLNKAALCKGFTFMATAYKSDQTDPDKLEADMGLYPDDEVDRLRDPKQTGQYIKGRTDWSTVEIIIECKRRPSEGDPFDDSYNNGETNAKKRRKALGQILSYAELVLNRQQRTHQYMILFIGQQARIVRFDRSGLVVTNRFSYVVHGEWLEEFLRYYADMRPSERGHDPTAVRLKPESEEVKRMKAAAKEMVEAATRAAKRKTAAADANGVPEDYVPEYVPQQFMDTLDEAHPWWKLTVHDESSAGTTKPRERHFLVAKPCFKAAGVVGRTTRGYIALEWEDVKGTDKGDSSTKKSGTTPRKNTLVFLKDAWRVDSVAIDKEGATLQTLHQEKVRFVPTLLCHGDVPDQNTSVTVDLWKEKYPGEKPLKLHQHYRLVVKEVGKPLDKMKSGVELLEAVWCALTAHSEAYEKGIIHRDISAGNILLYQDSDGDCIGLLNDWELSKKLSDQTETARQPDRTGTWQFLSVHALNNPARTITVQDELESFFHVILYHAVRLLPHNLPDHMVPQCLHDYFDDYTPHPKSGQAHCGHAKSRAMTEGRLNISSYQDADQNGGKAATTLKFFWTDASKQNTADDYPLNGLITHLLQWFKAHYALDSARDATEGLSFSQDSARLVPGKSGILAKSRRSVHKDVQATPSQRKVRRRGGVRAQAKNLEAHKQGNVETWAKNLEIHKPMLKAIEQALDKEWPLVPDAVEDKKPPPDWKPAGDLVPTGSKRTSQVAGNDAGGRTRKKTKS